MNWIELFLVAVAVLLSAAAFRQSGKGSSHQADAAARDALLRNELALLREGIDSLPGRIADETAASPLREAVEAVRGSIDRLGESFQALTESSRSQNAALASSLTESVKASMGGLSAPLATLLELQGRQVESASAQTKAIDSLAGAVRATSEAAASVRTETRTAILAGVERLADRTGALADGLHSGSDATSGLKASLESILSALDGLRGTWTESVNSLHSDLASLSRS